MLSFLVAINVIIAIFCGVPQWVRIYRRKSSADVSMLYVLCVLWLQISNAGIALWQGRTVQFEWFALNGALVFVTLIFVLRYRNVRKSA